jgi:hypothetical protein
MGELRRQFTREEYPALLAQKSGESFIFEEESIDS